MKKNANKKLSLPLILTLVIIIIAGLLILFRQPIKVSQEKNNQLPNETKQQFVFDSNKYKTIAKELFNRLSIDNPTAAHEVKQQLLDITVSKEFKDVHFDLVMASASLEKYSSLHDSTSLDQAKVLLAKLRKNYSWLSDKSL